MSQPKTAAPNASIFEQQLEERFGRKLRGVFDDILSEPTPDHFKDLIAKLGTKEDAK